MSTNSNRVSLSRTPKHEVAKTRRRRWLSGIAAGGLLATAPAALACDPADFNQSGTVSVDDLSAYMTAWFARDKASDTNSDGRITLDDLFDFVMLWSTGMTANVPVEPAAPKPAPAPKSPALAPAADSPLTMGPIYGPAVHEDVVGPLSRDIYTVTLRGGETTRVVVNGDSGTDLDLRVFDEFGNLIAADLDLTDYCIATLTPRWTGIFRIEIRNLGQVSNFYTISVR